MSVLAWMMGRPAAQEAAEHAAESGGEFDMGELIMHHLTDANELELPFVGALHLPTGWFVDAGPLGVIDLAPTKHVVLMGFAALLCVLFFLPLARTARRRQKGKAPVGMGGAMEALILYFRDEVVRRSIGRGADAYTSFILTLFFFILSMNLLGARALGRLRNRESLGYGGAGVLLLHRDRGVGYAGAGSAWLHADDLLCAGGGERACQGRYADDLHAG